MKKIVVFGNICIDLSIRTPYIPTNNEILKSNDFVISISGSGLNSTIAASKLGAEVDLIACVGSDTFGEDSIRYLVNNEIDTTHIRKVTDLPTGVELKIKVGEEIRTILYLGANEELNSDDLNAYILRHITANLVLLFSSPIKSEDILKALKYGKRANMKIIFHLNDVIKMPDYAYENIDYLIIDKFTFTSLFKVDVEQIEDCIALFNSLNLKGLESLIIITDASILFFSKTKVQKFDSKVNDWKIYKDVFLGAFSYCIANDKSTANAIIFSLHTAHYAGMREKKQFPSFDDVNCYLRGLVNNKLNPNIEVEKNLKI